MALSTQTEPLTSPAGDIAKALIEDALAPVSDDLAELGLRLSSFIPSESNSAKQVVEHVFAAGGKRIRPALYFMCCRLLGYESEHYFPIAAVTEFVHTASLLHDDVVDNSSLRRNKPTANSIWGDETSVLVGDLIYSTASELMAATGNMEIVKTFARAIRLMSDGELLQLENLYKADIEEKTYMRILEAKTASLIEAACRSAALLSQASSEMCSLLSRFGHSVGMAFQLIDDALDYTGAAAVVGKATLSDLSEGKVTLPVILVRERASRAEWQVLEDLLRAPERGSEAATTAIAKLVDKYDTAVQTVERAEHYTHTAMDILNRLPASARRDDLENLANKLLYRFS